MLMIIILPPECYICPRHWYLFPVLASTTGRGLARRYLRPPGILMIDHASNFDKRGLITDIQALHLTWVYMRFYCTFSVGSYLTYMTTSLIDEKGYLKSYFVVQTFHPSIPLPMASNHYTQDIVRICQGNGENLPSTTIGWYDKIYPPQLMSTLTSANSNVQPVPSPRSSIADAALVLPPQPLVRLPPAIPVRLSSPVPVSPSPAVPVSSPSIVPISSGPTPTAGNIPSSNTALVMELSSLQPQSRSEDEVMPNDLPSYVHRTVPNPQAAAHILSLLQGFGRLESKENITQLLETVPFLQTGDGHRWWKQNQSPFVSVCQILARSSVNTSDNPHLEDIPSTSSGIAIGQSSIDTNKTSLLTNLITTLTVAVNRRNGDSLPQIEKAGLKNIATSLAHMKPDQRDPHRLVSMLLAPLVLNKEDLTSVEELVADTLGFPKRESQQTNRALKQSSPTPPTSPSSISTHLHARPTSPPSAARKVTKSNSSAMPPSASSASSSSIQSAKLDDGWNMMSTLTKGNDNIRYNYWYRKGVIDVDVFEEPDSGHESYKVTYIVVLESKESTLGQRYWSLWYNLAPSGDDSEWTRAYINKRWFARARLILPESSEGAKRYLSYDARGSVGNKYLVPIWVTEETRRSHERNSAQDIPGPDQSYAFTL
ncbi:hypothetical protein K435DRAFT_803148 [Dendrothele bispora CBS 962.96]|uniref:Uncharacterized protein n=1 Tax=Dendrothele bispora (strain CBS 962.96) TaxID=1314807 RepID=A0A4V4HDX7_DENBC|nr:hypothetical protein K435DRAFT_803148 [Dendrothele bispora CBS 962.96]